ncbi:MAG TPA: hypothetical protein VFS76_24905 [Pyrinomonadaceae bacterium]|nr:hypothetical protein [Pyrinomonadaceae bacterium]
MGLKDDFFERFGRRRRKLTPEQAKLLREMLVKAYNLVYYILGDTKDTKPLALRALAGLMCDFQRLKHRPVRQTHYRYRQSEPAIHRVPLPIDLELAVRVFTLTISYQWDKLSEPTLEDLDVWFCKCVLLESLRHNNAFSALYGMSNGIHVYTEQDATRLFDTLTEEIPRTKEAWNEGNEPLRRYRKRLTQAIDLEFRSVIRRDHKGNLIRRPLSEQPVKFIAECLNNLVKLEPGDVCFGTFKPDHSRFADLKSELARLHIVLHWPCYTALTQTAGCMQPKDKAGMPEYAKMLNGNGTQSREAPALSDNELDTMVNQFQLMVDARAEASSKIIVTVDDREWRPSSIQLTEKGHVELKLCGDAKLVEIWALDNDQQKVLLSAFFLSSADDHQILTLEAGQRISFASSYREAADGEGGFDVTIDYRETQFSRRFQRLIPDRYKPNFSVPLLRPAVVLSGVGIIVAFALLLPLLYWIGAFKPISALWSRSSQTIVKQESHPTGNQEVAPAESRGVGSESSPNERPDPSPHQPALADANAGATPRKKSSSQVQSSQKSVAASLPPRSYGEVPSLASIERIYVESTGVYDSSEVNQQVYSMQIDAIKKSRMFDLKDDPTDAQARLIMVSDFESGTGDKAQAQLITTKDGKVIWYGPLVSIARDNDPQTAANEIHNLVQSVTDALVKKKKALRTEKPVNNVKRGRKTNR